MASLSCTVGITAVRIKVQYTAYIMWSSNRPPSGGSIVKSSTPAIIKFSSDKILNLKLSNYVSASLTLLQNCVLVFFFFFYQRLAFICSFGPHIHSDLIILAYYLNTLLLCVVLYRRIPTLQICLAPSTAVSLLNAFLPLLSSPSSNYTHQNVCVKTVLGCIHNKSNATWMQHKRTLQLFICSH